MTPQQLIDAFFDTGQHLTALVAPYALHLLYLLILVELLTLAIAWMMGSDDPFEFPWRILRLIFTGMFAYWWLINAWTLGLSLIGSFDQIGRNISNTPGGLAPSQFFNVGLRIAKILWDSPSSTRMIPNFGLAILEGILIVNILFFLGLLAAVAAFSLVSMMLILGPGSIFVSFMPCRFTSSLSENYFIWLVRTGALLLGFYVILATCQHFAELWYANLVTICGHTSTFLPIPFLGGAPVTASAVTCTVPIPVATLLTLYMDIILLLLVGLGVPFALAAMAGHGVHLALENLASARYIASSVARPISGAVRGLTHQVNRMTQNNNNRSMLEQRLAAGAAAANATTTRPSQISTQRLLKPPPSNAFGVPRTQGLPNGNRARSTTKI
jgi:hypothetical protein